MAAALTQDVALAIKSDVEAEGWPASDPTPAAGDGEWQSGPPTLPKMKRAQPFATAPWVTGRARGGVGDRLFPTRQPSNRSAVERLQGTRIQKWDIGALPLT